MLTVARKDESLRPWRFTTFAIRREAPALAFDFANLVPLCKSHHSRRTLAAQRSGRAEG